MRRRLTCRGAARRRTFQLQIWPVALDPTTDGRKTLVKIILGTLFFHQTRVDRKIDTHKTLGTTTDLFCTSKNVRKRCGQVCGRQGGRGGHVVQRHYTRFVPTQKLQKKTNIIIKIYFWKYRWRYARTHLPPLRLKGKKKKKKKKSFAGLC